MDFTTCFKTHKTLLMEGALGERLKREFHIQLNDNIGLANLALNKEYNKTEVVRADVLNYCCVIIV